MDCGIPFCHALGCPVVNLIPEWNDLVYKGKWHEAYMRLEMTNTLPEVTGRICPAPCEASCTLSINSSPVTIKQIELAIIENAFKQGWVVPRPPICETGKKLPLSVPARRDLLRRSNCGAWGIRLRYLKNPTVSAGYYVMVFPILSWKNGCLTEESNRCNRKALFLKPMLQ
jgi:hypothetical protein